MIFFDLSRAFLTPQARLESSWRALFVPAKLKLDFLQKYCTLERALELPRTAHLLEIASKAVPLREKVRVVNLETGRTAGGRICLYLADYLLTSVVISQQKHVSYVFFVTVLRFLAATHT